MNFQSTLVTKLKTRLVSNSTFKSRYESTSYYWLRLHELDFRTNFPNLNQVAKLTTWATELLRVIF